MTYDPEARRLTPLALKLKARIRREGPITVRDYMRACLRDPEHGYYRVRPAIGAGADFITAPEISQVFGELIGLWAGVVWQSMGKPARVRLVEFGPGRGTLMRDALMAARLVPGFVEAADIVLFESSRPLQDVQRATLAGQDLPLRWVSGYEDLDFDRPAIIIGNEFLDTFPADQLERVEGGWILRRVGLDQRDRLVFTHARPLPGRDRPQGKPRPELDRLFPEARPGDIVEHARRGFADEALVAWPRLAALFIDYGHMEPAIGDTLQAVREHRAEHPLTSPGEADLTQQVPFHAFLEALLPWDHLAAERPLTQAEFLGRLGIVERASRLMAANPLKAAEIEAAVARLMAPSGMGGRFKAVGVRSRDVPPLPGFGG
jgi:SAM-dependent MidA family methyltransferase